MKSILPKMPDLKWMSSFAKTMEEGAAEGLEFMSKAAPLALDAAAVIAPLLLDEDNLRVSASAEVRRYNTVIEATKAFGDQSVVAGVDESFKEALKYYRDQIQQGNTYVKPYSQASK